MTIGEYIIVENNLDIAIRSAKALNLKWAGVDIVTNKNTGKNYRNIKCM